MRTVSVFDASFLRNDIGVNSTLTSGSFSRNSHQPDIVLFVGTPDLTSGA